MYMLVPQKVRLCQGSTGVVSRSRKPDRTRIMLMVFLEDEMNPKIGGHIPYSTIFPIKVYEP